MAKTYYMGLTKAFLPVLRASQQDYGYTHAAGPNGYRKWNFSTSAAGALKNAETDGAKCPEVVPVYIVDRETFMAAKSDPMVAQRPAAPRPALEVPQGPFPTREAWMMAFVTASRPMFLEVGAELPAAIRVSIGHPSKGIRSKVIGECWTNKASADGAVEIFIRPTLQDDTPRLADVLTHELIHAALGTEEGHGPNFRRTMKRLGLEGKPTATVAGDQWRSWALPIVEALGPLPGAKLTDMALAGGKKTQTTRYLKVTCGLCSWQARVTAKHLEGRTLNCPDAECHGELERSDP